MHSFEIAGGWRGRSPPLKTQQDPHNPPYSKHGDGMMLRFIASMGGPESSESLRVTTVIRIWRSHDPCHGRHFQNQRGSEGLKATMTGLGFRVTAPGLMKNERMGLGTIIRDRTRDQLMKIRAHSSQLLERMNPDVDLWQRTRLLPQPDAQMLSRTAGNGGSLAASYIP